jgi:hypothetical protein
LSLQAWIRQSHRWLGILLTLSILANFGAMALGKPPSFVVYAPLAPLTLLVFSGLYLFFLPSRNRLADRENSSLSIDTL